MSAEHGTSGSSVIGGPRGMRRKAVRATELVQTGFLSNNEGRLPLLITPAVDNVDVTGWCARNAADVEHYLEAYESAQARDGMLQLPAGTSSSRPENRSGRADCRGF